MEPKILRDFLYIETSKIIQNMSASGYEEIKQNLTQLGFVLEENCFVKEVIRKRSMVINGQHISKDIKHRFVIEYIGEGQVSNMDESNRSTIYGFAIKPDGTIGMLDVWVDGWDDLKEVLGR